MGEMNHHERELGVRKESYERHRMQELNQKER